MKKEKVRVALQGAAKMLFEHNDYVIDLQNVRPFEALDILLEEGEKITKNDLNFIEFSSGLTLFWEEKTSAKLCLAEWAWTVPVVRGAC